MSDDDHLEPGDVSQRYYNRLLDHIRRLRSDMERGLSASRILIEDRTARLDRVEKEVVDHRKLSGEHHAKFVVWEERWATLRSSLDELKREIGKLESELEEIEKSDLETAAKAAGAKEVSLKLQEKLKPWLPVLVAIVSGIVTIIGLLIQYFSA